MFYLLFFDKVDSSLTYFIFSSVLGSCSSDSLFICSPVYCFAVVSSQKVSYSSLSYSWSPLPIFWDRNFNAGTLQVADLTIEIQIDSTRIYSPRSSFLARSSIKDVTSLTSGSCISMKEGRMVIMRPEDMILSYWPKLGKYLKKMSMIRCLFLRLALL